MYFANLAVYWLHLEGHGDGSQRDRLGEDTPSGGNPNPNPQLFSTSAIQSKVINFLKWNGVIRARIVFVWGLPTSVG